MVKSKLLLGYMLLFLLIMASATPIKAQMVGTDAYIQGASVEIGISGSGGYEGCSTTSSPTPGGYHYRGSSGLFGFYANPQLNAWSGSAYDGDFFTPGSPENGWGFEIGGIGGTGTTGTSNCSGGGNIPGSITSFTSTPLCHILQWDGDMTTGTDVHFKIVYTLEQTDLFYTTEISVTNNTLATIPDMYYYRNFDPDNNQSNASADGFTTQNTIVCQPTPGGSSVAAVSATQNSPWLSYVGLAAIGQNWRCDYGGFSNRDASDLWWGTGFTQTVGSTNYADEAISLAYRIQNLAPGATTTFKFNVILSDAAATGLLYVNHPGIVLPAICDTVAPIDTIAQCGSPVPLNIAGSTASNYSWTWSPATGLSTSTGDSVIANPTSTTTYTATGTPISPCVPPVTVSLQFVMIVLAPVAPPVVSPVPTVCIGSPPFNVPVTSSAPGTWSGTGITNSSLGTFTPSVAGSFLVTYSTSGFCVQTDTTTITVVGSDPTITPHGPVCQGSAPYTLTAATSGGAWSGTGVSSSGVFTPSTAGSFVITYSISGVCTSVDTVTLVVNPTTPPVTGITYTSPVCISGPNPTLTTAAGFTTGGVYSSTPAGLSLSSTTGAVNLSASSAGTYTITYSFAATGCGPAGSSTTTLVINPLAIPTLVFSYPTVCKDADTVAPVLGAGFTTGGTFTAPPGVVINDSTGVIDLTSTPAGTYTITYSVVGSSSLCTASGSNTASITINPLPVITFSAEQYIFVGQGTLIYATGGTSYSWSPIQYLSSTNNDSTIASPPETTDYCVAVTDLGCTDTACTKVHVEIPCPSNRTMGVPNAFTPNGDGVNDQLCLQGWSDCISKFEIVIFDRWGEKMFESSDPGFCWDGIYKGKPLDPAVFVYFIKASYETAGATPISPRGVVEQNKKGNISLVR
jgi:gliding motility-associated-like protein